MGKAATLEPARRLSMQDRPNVCLGAKPKCRSVDDENTALREKGFLLALAKAINAEREMKLRELNAQFDAMLLVTIGDDDPISHVKRIELLDQAIEEFALHEHADIKNGTAQKRSLKLAEGKIAWQKARDSVVFAANKNATTALAAIDQLLDGEPLVAQINELLDTIEVTVDEEIVPVSEIVKVKIEIERSALLDSFREKKISREILRAIGLLFEKGRDYFKAEPNEYRPPEIG